MIFRLFLNFLTTILVTRISNFMMVKMTKGLKAILKMLKLEKRRSSDQFFYLLKLVEKWFYYTARMLSWLFDISKSTVSYYLVIWTNLLYFSAGKIVIWPSKVQVLDTMPETLKTTTHQLEALLTAQKYFAKDHRHCHPTVVCIATLRNVTFKELLGTAPSGAITFISELHEGSISDKKIVRTSGILIKNLWDDNDSIMADMTEALQLK